MFSLSAGSRAQGRLWSHDSDPCHPAGGDHAAGESVSLTARGTRFRGWSDPLVPALFRLAGVLSGVGEGEIMAWVGHRDSKMVAHYRHLGNADARRKMNQIDFLGERSVSDGPSAQAS